MKSNKRSLKILSIRATNGTSPYPRIDNTTPGASTNTSNSNSYSSVTGTDRRDNREYGSGCHKSGLQSRIMQQLEVEEGHLALAYLRTERCEHYDRYI